MTPSARSEALTLKDRIKDPLKALVNLHRPDGSPNVFVFTMPRSGSSWLMELIGDQPGFKTCSEPLNVRLPLVRTHLGVRDWGDLHEPGLTPRLQAYFQAICDGRLHFLDPIPFRSNAYRFASRRIVFKVIHGGEERIDWFRDSFNGRIVYLLRHPIAVSLSHEVFPRLHAYVESEYRHFFTDEQLALARDVIADGSELEHGVLAWCFENAVPLRLRSPDWVVVTYEQMVLEPEPIVRRLIERLDLHDPDRMMDRLTVASGVKRKSDPATQRLLEQEDRSSRERLVRKWQDRVSEDAARRAMDILRRFDLDAYAHGSALPAHDLWLRP